MIHDTVAFNTAPSGQGGGLAGPGANFVLENTLVANSPGGGNFDPNTSFTSRGGNLSDDGTGSAFLTQPGDLNNTPANLGPLEDNGGPTLTYSLLPGSAAIRGAHFLAPTALGVDQRGFARPTSGAVLPSIGAFEPQAPLGTSANARFVESVVETLLQHPATSAFLPFVTQLNKGIARATVVADIENSTEYLHLVATNMFQRLLGRAPTTQNLTDVTAYLSKGGAIELTQASLISSAEYFQKHGGTNSAFVSAAFQDTLGRAPTAAELARYVAVLGKGGSRLTFARTLVQSAEFRTNFVTSSFVQYLNQLPTDAQLNGLVMAMQNGYSEQTILAKILAMRSI